MHLHIFCAYNCFCNCTVIISWLPVIKGHPQALRFPLKHRALQIQTHTNTSTHQPTHASQSKRSRRIWSPTGKRQTPLNWTLVNQAIGCDFVYSWKLQLTKSSWKEPVTKKRRTYMTPNLENIPGWCMQQKSRCWTSRVSWETGLLHVRKGNNAHLSHKGIITHEDHVISVPAPPTSFLS